MELTFDIPSILMNTKRLEAETRLIADLRTSAETDVVLNAHSLLRHHRRAEREVERPLCPQQVDQWQPKQSLAVSAATLVKLSYLEIIKAGVVATLPLQTS